VCMVTITTTTAEKERERESYDDRFLISPKVAFDKMGCFIFIELLREKIEERFPRGVSETCDPSLNFSTLLHLHARYYRTDRQTDVRTPPFYTHA